MQNNVKKQHLIKYFHFVEFIMVEGNYRSFSGFFFLNIFWEKMLTKIHFFPKKIAKIIFFHYTAVYWA